MMRPGRYSAALSVLAVFAMLGSCKDVVAPPAVATISLSDNSPDLVPDETEQVVATPREASGSPLARPITWSSSAPQIATVADGLVTAHQAGTAVITAASEGISAAANVTVDDGGLMSPAGNLISVLGGEFVLQVPSAAVSQLAPVMMAPADSPPASSRLVRGSAVSLRIQAPLIQPAILAIRYDPSQVLNSPESGLRMFRAVGSAWQELPESSVDIASRTVRGSITGPGTYAILIQAAVAGISVTPASKSLNAGETFAFASTAEDADGVPLAGRAVSWESSAPQVLQIDGTSGVATARAPGTAVVTAQAEGISGNATVTVTPGAASQILIVAGDGQIADTSAAVTVVPSVKVTDALGFSVAAASVTFAVTSGGGSVSPASVLTDANGIASVSQWKLGPQKGTNTLTASIDASHFVTFTATGSQPPAPVASVAIVPATPTIAAGQSLGFSAVAKDADGNVLNGRTASWSVSDPVVLQIDPASGAASALQPGATTVSVIVEGKTAATQVSVAPGPATRIFIVAGDKQTADAGSPVPVAPSVRVNDKLGFAIVGASVSFTVTSGGGSVTPATVFTDATGTATVSKWVLGNSAGDNSLTATVAGAGSITLTSVGTQPAAPPPPPPPPPGPPPPPPPPTVRIVTFGDSNTDAGYSGTNPVFVAVGYVSSDPARAPPEALNNPTQLAGKIEAKWSAVRANPIIAVNHGISGTRSGDGRTGATAPNALLQVNGVARFDAEVLGTGYPWNGGESGDMYPNGAILRRKSFVPGPLDFAYVSIGTNDFADNLTTDQSAANISSMIDRWIAAGHAASHFIITTLAPRDGSLGLIPPLNTRIRAIAAARGVGLIDIAGRTSDDNGATWRSTADNVGDSIHYSEAVRDWIADQVVSYMLQH
jgi:GDSL-like lipase/acylhydrolase family protein/Big-like domain-containing protein